MSRHFRAPAAAVLLLVTLVTGSHVCAQTAGVNGQLTGAQDTVDGPFGPVQVTAFHQEIWSKGGTRVIAFRGGRAGHSRAVLQHNKLMLAGNKLVVVETVTAAGHDLRVYAEGQVTYRNRAGTVRNAATHTIRLSTVDPLAVSVAHETSVAALTDLMKTAGRALWPQSRTVATPVSQQVDSEFEPLQFQPVPLEPQPRARRIQIRPRSSTPLQFDSRLSSDTVPPEQVYVITGGVNVIVDGAEVPVQGRNVSIGALDLSADKVVIWTDPINLNGDTGGGGFNLSDLSLTETQIYLEGNIVVRQDQNRVTASHAFYDVGNDRALLINAELQAFLPQTGGTVRVRAERLRQLSRNQFHAQNGWTTTSPYGKPGYRLQASDIFVEPGPVSPFTEVDQTTGLPVNGNPLWITSLNTEFLAGDVPLLRLPRVTVPAEDPNIPIRRAVVRQDRIFGVQVKTVWDLTKVLGQRREQGTQWDLILDYLQERGPTVGVEGSYETVTPRGRAIGEASFIYQYDDGVDVLGLDRLSLQPDAGNRGQAIWRHRQDLGRGTYVFGELGFVSDRNFRESFLETQNDTEKDVETILGIRSDSDSGLWSGSVWARYELNEFETSTDWLPRGDLYGFSQPLFGGLLSWSSHSSVGYADVEPGAAPDDPADPFTPLAQPFYVPGEGLVAFTRHQIDAPFSLGPVNINPFLLGEAAFFNQGLVADDVDRFGYSGGVQAHLAATRVYPQVRNALWNLNGLAHKVDTYIEYRNTDFTRGLDEIAQFNEFDDNTQERFRTRFATQIFPGLIPAEFDPRFYAVRAGAGLAVSAPFNELVDDQEVIRLRVRQRLQTKSGPLNSQRIRDWMLFESGVSFFPNAGRDNFGEAFGLLYGSYRWNVNDRTSLLANGTFDFFSNRQNLYSVGLLSQRSLRGSIYLGFRQVQARNFLDSQTLVASYSYQLSPKWISTGAIAYDVAEEESRGSSLTFSRVGLDWVLHVGFGIDTSKDNVGVAVALEPRFGPPSATNLSHLLGLSQ